MDLARQTRRDEEWRTWPSVKAYISNLPRGVTTYDIHRNFSRFGNVEFIRMEETRQGNFAGQAIIVFKPPPPGRAPWDEQFINKIHFHSRRNEGEPLPRIKVRYEARPPNRFVESPVRSGVKYDPEVTLYGSAIDFGYLSRPECMVVKAQRQNSRGDAVRLRLNLTRLEMEVHFPVVIHSRGRAIERAYRFSVALDEQFSLCEVHSNGSTALIIHLNNTPWYSRQLKEAMGLSHDDNSSKWSSDDTWSRQTDIVDEKETFQKINDTPVSVQKLHNSIDIARWTTFRVTIRPDIDRDQNSLGQFLTALADFNIRVSRDSSFLVVIGQESPAPFWDFVDGTGSQSWSEELLLPRRLDFDLRYQLEVCISKRWLNEFSLTREFLQKLSDMPTKRAKQMLIHVDLHQQRVYDPMSIFTDLRYTKPVLARAPPANCAEIYSATVTATGVVFHTPSVEITNRIVRRYSSVSNHFLRVRFEDDPYRGQTRLWPATNGKMKLVFDRVRRTMKHGIVLGGRRYEFLAWGNSQIREHGAYFFAASQHPRITVDDIRRDMGIFDHEKVVAKRAARMGQCFATTTPFKILNRDSHSKEADIPDIKNGKYNFTDGVGKISRLTALHIKNKLKLSGEEPPSAFQFRLGGCKGVLALDPTLTNSDVKIRPSQRKFDSGSNELEIIRVSEFWRPFLNRQLILVLSALGVPDVVFLRMQQKCIEDLDAAMRDDTVAVRALRENVDPNLMTPNIAAMIEAGFSQLDEPFVASIVRLWRAWMLKSLKEKAKIPVSQGAFVLGVVDETGTLRGHINDLQPGPNASREEREKALPEVFIQYTDPQKNVRCLYEGVCIIARNPSLHRGDIRVVRAVNCAPLRHMCDVLVMPSVGDRDLPSMCSGGDLDGDDYIVIWDPELLPKEWNAEPFHYNAPEPVRKENVSIDDIINFFYDYMQNDYLGRIAHAHLAAADCLPDGIDSEQCLKLVGLHSMAVDYPKTGVPALMTRDLERSQWPHFMEKKRSGVYRSTKILGRLYDAVGKAKFEPHLLGDFDERILIHAPQEEVIGFVRSLKESYDESMRRIMAQHQIASEFEVWSTFVLHHSKASKDYKFHEEIGQHAKTLKDQYYEAFREEAGGHDLAKLRPYAIAAYHITHEEYQKARKREEGHGSEDEDGSALSAESSGSVSSASTSAAGVPFISFPWVLQETLQQVAKNTVIHEDGGALQVNLSPTSVQNDKEDGVLEPGRALCRWTHNGDHLQDPYVAVPIDAEVRQDEFMAVPNHGPLDPAGLDSSPSPAQRASLKDVVPTKPPTAAELGHENDLSPSGLRLVASSNMPSVVSSGGSSSHTSPDDARPPWSVVARSHGRSADIASLSGLMPTEEVQSSSPVKLTDAHHTQSKGNESRAFQDPGSMAEGHIHALAKDPDDDDDDFTF
ncbi:RNA-dependent RNA polymerase 1 [Cladophialophora carrionii]|uniref:RNA-dependent RNA polymerase n=1 Tax=Cladophialophora carrionii TaxID=86049 RepID=A0A1C1CYY7_9EURO|nr:RNA-dependent RNA polymerase 1 [Cladophialophora carrionii]